MAREATLVTAFNAGEISTKIDHRQDLATYGNALRILENFIPEVQGAATRRPGTRLIAVNLDSARKGRLVDFEFNEVQAYQIEFGHFRLRFYRDRGLILDDSAVVNGDFTADIAGWSSGSSGTGTITHDAGAGRLSLNGGGAGNEARAIQELTSIGIASYSVTLDVLGGDVTWKAGTSSGGAEIATGVAVVGPGQTFSFQATAAGSVFITFENANNDTRQIDNVALDNPVYELDSPYGETDLPALTWVQSFDVLFLDHPDIKERKLLRFGNADWQLVTSDFKDGPYDDENTDTTKTLQPSATTGPVTITAAGHAPFVASDVGRLLRIKHSATFGWAEVTVFTSTTQVGALVKGDFAAITASSEWQLGIWSATTGFPGAWPSFHQERLGRAGARAFPDRFDLSRTNDFENMTPGANASDAISRRLASNKVNAIKWLVSKTQLFVGTLERAYRVVGDELNAALKPDAVDAKPVARIGASGLRPLEVVNRALFVNRFGKRIFVLAFDISQDDFLPNEISRRARHVIRAGIVDWAVQDEPWDVVWLALADGTLASLTYVPQEEVIAFARHPLGGGGQVESLSVIPGPGADELWLMVKRTVNGQVLRTVELLDDEFDEARLLADAFFVDSGLTYDGPPIATVAGLDHLEGATVQVLADGAVHPDLVVVGGQVTLRKPAGKIHIGLGYVTRLKPVRPEAGALQGTSRGRLQRIHEVVVAVERSLGFKTGRDEAHLEAEPFRKVGDPMGQPPALFSGDKLVDGFDGDYDPDAGVLIVQDQPLPLTVKALVTRLSTQEI